MGHPAFQAIKHIETLERPNIHTTSSTHPTVPLATTQSAAETPQVLTPRLET